MFKFLRHKFAASDPEQYLRTDHLMADLKGKSVRGGMATLGSQAFKFGLQMVTTAVLARLLVPEDYGLIGMTGVVVGFIEIFKDMGLSEATVQKEEITQEQVSTLFWLNVGLATALALLIIAISPLVALFYREPRVQGIMIALSINFIFSGLCVQHNALIKRQMQFAKIAKITVFSNMIGPAVGIISASMGNGYWALVHMFNASTFSYMVVLWLTCRWRPGRFYPNSGVGSMLKFGGNLTGFQVVNYFSRNLDNFLIGRYWGAAQLGLYAKAYQLVLLPINQINSPVNSVAMPALSRLQTEPEKYRRFYYRAILLMTSIGMPIICFLFATAEDVIPLLLGDQWLQAVPIFRLLAPAAFLGTFNVASGWVLQSLNKTDKQFKWGIVTSTFNSIIFMVSVRWGATGVAAAYGLSRPFILIPTLLYSFHNTPIKVSALFRALFYPAFTSIFSAIILYLIGIGRMSFSAFSSLAIQGFIYLILYCASWLILPGGREKMNEVIESFSAQKSKASQS